MTQSGNSKMEIRNSKLQIRRTRHSRPGGDPLRLALLLVVICLAASRAPAQVVTGFPPFSSQTPSTFDTVNDANLNASFAIPVVSKAGRGMPFQYSMSTTLPCGASGTRSGIWSGRR